MSKSLRSVFAFTFLMLSTTSLCADGPQKINIEVNNAPLDEVLSLIAGDKATILTVGNLGGTISIGLKDKTIAEVLTFISEIKGLRLLKVSDALFVLYESDVQVRAYSSAKRFERIQLKTREASQLADQLQQRKLLPAGVDSVVAFEPGNSLIVFGTEDGIRKLKAIIQELDKDATTELQTDRPRYERILLRYVEAGSLAKRFAPRGEIALPEGVQSIVSFDPGNALIVYGTKAGIEKLRVMLKALDKEDASGKQTTRTEVIRVKNVDARKLSEKFDPKDPANLIPGLVSLVPDARTNSLIVVGTEEAVTKVQARVKELDKKA